MHAGGPAGGNGGSGGNVWVQADDSLNSLTTFRKQVHYRADSGRPGGGSNMTGANAEDLIIKVCNANPAGAWHLVLSPLASPCALPLLLLTAGFAHCWLQFNGVPYQTGAGFTIADQVQLTAYIYGADVAMPNVPRFCNAISRVS